jgi:glycosyltransferase involved in cell wall biosynthesis
MVKVLLMIDDAAVGGGQRHVLWLAERLDRDRFQVSVACQNRGYLVDELRKRDITVYPLSMSNYLSFTSLWRCVRLLRNIDPTVLHTHGGTAGFVGRVASLFAPVKGIIHTYHGIHYLHYGVSIRRILYTWMDRLLLRWTDRLICVAQNDFDLGSRSGVINPTKSVVIRNGIDVHHYGSNRRLSDVGNRDKGNSNHKIVGTIGRLHVQKGHAYLIEAAKLVVEKFPSTVFQIIGDGELRQSLERRSRTLGIENNVQFLGTRPDVPELLAHMDVFVLPSLWEGMPIVILEAMAARKPIVASDVDGVSEIVLDKEDGILVPPKNPEKLAQVIILILTDQDLAECLGQRGFDKVVSQFGIDTTVARTQELYDSVLEGQG